MSQDDKHSGLLPCPFCGSADIDAEFSLVAGPGGSPAAHHEPGCMTCGATAPAHLWNNAPRSAASPSNSVVVPRELTAENGAKAALSGEFTFEPYLGHDGKTLVPWDMIKQIHRRVVELFGAPSSDRRSIADCVPDNWLDPLLTGPKAVLKGSGPWGCQDIEALLRALRSRIREAEAGR